MPITNVRPGTARPGRQANDGLLETHLQTQQKLEVMLRWWEVWCLIVAQAKAAGIPDRDITVLRAEEGASRFDPTGAVHVAATHKHWAGEVAAEREAGEVGA